LSQLNLQPLYKGHFAVETFFYISGLLTSYVTLKLTGGQLSRFKVWPYLILRYLRLTPQVIAFLWASSLLPPLFDGPIWREYIGKIEARCYQNWWLTLLYVQNFFDVKNMVRLCSTSYWGNFSLIWNLLVRNSHLVLGSGYATTLDGTGGGALDAAQSLAWIVGLKCDYSFYGFGVLCHCLLAKLSSRIYCYIKDVSRKRRGDMLC